jgi:hypothetical protein
MQTQEPNIDARFRTMLVLWFALLFSVGMYLAFCFIAFERSTEPANRLLSFAFAAIATFTVILSFVIKQKLLRRSEEQQNLMVVQQAFVVAWAMCEVSAILAVIEYILLDTRDYLVLFALSAVGMVLHFPTRKHLLNASFKKQGWQ